MDVISMHARTHARTRAYSHARQVHTGKSTRTKAHMHTHEHTCTETKCMHTEKERKKVGAQDGCAHTAKSFLAASSPVAILVFLSVIVSPSTSSPIASIICAFALRTSSFSGSIVKALVMRRFASSISPLSKRIQVTKVLNSSPAAPEVLLA